MNAIEGSFDMFDVENKDLIEAMGFISADSQRLSMSMETTNKRRLSFTSTNDMDELRKDVSKMRKDLTELDGKVSEVLDIIRIIAQRAGDDINLNLEKIDSELSLFTDTNQENVHNGNKKYSRGSELKCRHCSMIYKYEKPMRKHYMKEHPFEKYDEDFCKPCVDDKENFISNVRIGMLS
tara:strand:+ start:187 stop:726 length:540 start_codon:yes stop_codon:yes gene_type:complete